MLIRIYCAVVVVAAMAWASSPVSAVTVADLGSNYQAAALGSSTASFNAGTGISDTAGTGRWNFLQANSGGGSPSLLTFQASPGDSGQPGYGGSAGASELGFAMPAISKNLLFNSGTVPAANAVNIHPGNENPVEIIAQWTVGQAGLYDLAGGVTRYSGSGTGVASVVRINGVDLSPAEITTGGRQTGFNYLRNLNVGDTVAIVVGPNGDFFSDESAVRFRATQLEGRLLANVGGDYRPAANGQTSASINIMDTAGQGTWRYFGSDNINLDATAGEVLGVFGAVGNGGNSGYGGGLNGFNMSAVSDLNLFGDGEVPLDDELALHPADSTRVFEVLRWTAGAGEEGGVNVVGNIRNPVVGGDSIEFYVLVDGATLFSTIATSSTLPMTFFDFNATVQLGSTIDFVLGRRGGFAADESVLSAFIVQLPVPEPATLTLAFLGGAALMGRRRRVA
jgi:hypothetical protein